MSMVEPTFGPGHGTGGAARIDRRVAATWLRRARAGDPESTDWVFAVLPESVAVRRTMIARTLDLGHHDEADVLLAQGLLQHPGHAGLALLRAQSLFEQARYDEAATTLTLVLRERPSSRRAALLSGRIELVCGRPQAAVVVFLRLIQAAPNDDVRTWSIRAALAAERPEQARAVLDSMLAPPPALTAEVLTAEGRFLDAIEHLEAALGLQGVLHSTARPVESWVSGTGADDDTESHLCGLIDLLEEAADARRLRDVLAPITASHPKALLRAAKAWLALGAFETAARRVLPLLRRPARGGRPGDRSHRGPALAVLLVAATMIGRRRLANLALHRLQRETCLDEAALIPELWGRGLLGQVLFNQRSARRAGSDPHSERLGSLLSAAEPVLRSAIAADGVSEPWLEHADAVHRADQCQGLLEAIRSPVGVPGGPA